MAQHIKLRTNDLPVLRSVDPRLVSYNIEMTEVTGGTFWKEYTTGQKAGTEKFPLIGITSKGSLMQVYPPADLSNGRLRKMAKALGPVWVRVSGTWSTKTYYDLDDTTGGVIPEGFQSVLTRSQWISVLDFVRDVGGKLLVSVSNCAGIHSAHEPWKPDQAMRLFDFSREYGVPIEAAEFMNEPNMLAGSGAPKGYKYADYQRDQDLFFRWLRENEPDVLAVGPCTVGDGQMGKMKFSGKFCEISPFGTKQLMKGTQEKLDVFSYHYYNGVSERITAGLHFVHWPVEKAHTEAYLDAAPFCARTYAPMRDKYVPGGQMWVTEAGDAGGGGCTWASTYLDVLRTLNELGSFAAITDGVIFHNTLASSDYGWLKHGTFEPRPNYFAVLLWNTLMGTTVYASGEPIREGAHVYCHSRKDGKNGCVYLVINNSLTDSTTVELPAAAEVYALAGRDGMRSSVMTLNGRPLVLGPQDELPDLTGETVSGRLELAPGTCTFLVLP